jgi:prophage regulatory protein
VFASNKLQTPFLLGDMTMGKTKERVVRKPELLAMIGLSDPTIWRMEKDGKFPRRIRLGGNSCGWLLSEVMDFLEQKAKERT